ncbi:MAG TPA: carboxypeptidase-like regulatory domain-containing protein, partial [Chitinophagaceae bacterium]
MKNLLARMLLVCLAAVCFLEVSAQEKKQVRGVVRDAEGNPVASATISEKGTKNYVLSDTKGAFSISVNPSATLVVSSVGFAAREISANNSGVADIRLEGSAVEIAGVVVTSLGIKKEQRKLGYAATKINSDDIIKTAPTNFASALYAKAPGLAINSNPGGATSAVALQIRGINSINFQRQPLLVVDGAVVRNGAANNDGFWGGNQRVNG